MDIVTIDFETYYDKDYSLSKMTTEAYVRSPDFEIIGVGIKVNDYPTDWYSGDNPGKFLKSLDYSKRAILCHNTAFDGAILSWHFGIRPRLWLDTLSMARPFHSMTVGGSLAKLVTYYGLGKKGDEVVAALGKRKADFTEADLAQYGQYCINDVNLTKQLFDKLKVGFPSSELLAIDQTLRMYTEPMIELDVPLLEKHLGEVRTRKRTLMADLGHGMGGEAAVQEMLMSNEKFANYLKALGVEPPTKISAKTGKEAWAFAKTDKGMTDLLEHPDDRVQAAVSARLGVKSTLEETRTEALIGVAGRGRLPIMLNYYGAHTGRFSGGDKLNLQNLPSRGNTTIKRALKAPPGNVLIASDSSQIEARMVAYIAGQDDLVEAFRDKRDVYSEFATEVYGRKITKADKVERFVGKTCILGLGYGMGAAKLQRTLEIGQGGISVKVDLNEAERIVRIYRAKNFRIVQFWQKCGNALTAMTQGRSGNLHDTLTYDNTGVTMPNRFKIQYPALRASTNGFMYINDARTYQKAVRDRVLTGNIEELTWTKIYGGKMTENIIQALAAIVIREQMASIGQHYHVAFQVHDEIIITAPEADAPKAEAKLVEIMSTPPKWAPGLPVACESGAAGNYGDT
jgi:DNA polymerase